MRNLADHRTTGLHKHAAFGCNRPKAPAPAPSQRALAAARVLLSLCGALILASLAAEPSAARPNESAYCQNLRAQISQAGGDRGSAASGRQRAELGRLQARSQGLGCGRPGFLIFGGGDPAECGALQSRIAQLAAAVSSGGYWGGSNRNALLARYEAECRQGYSAPQEAEPQNIFEAIFGGRARRGEPLVEGPGGVVLNPDDPGYYEGDARAQGGSEAVCVRQCDGGFFPVSYSARHGSLQDLNELCRAQCPNAEAMVYTKSLWRDIETAVSIDGEPYSALPNALKFQKQRVAACSCKPPGVSWAQALEGAERMLSFDRHHDSILTAEEAERLSRPLPVGGSSRRVASGQSARRDSRGVVDAPPLPAPQEAAASGIGLDQGVTREVTGPDGTKKRVRVIAPAL